MGEGRVSEGVITVKEVKRPPKTSWKLQRGKGGLTADSPQHTSLTPSRKGRIRETPDTAFEKKISAVQT